MFTSFHHFPFDEARNIIQSAVNARQGIGIFEITRRTPSAILLIVLSVLTPFFLHSFCPSVPLVAPVLHLCRSDHSARIAVRWSGVVPSHI